MAIKFLHTSDWQIGMKTDSVGRVAQLVREERLAAAARVIQTAKEHGASMLLITGDVFEDNAVDRLLVRKVGQILSSFNGRVFVIPGNHDPLMPGSVWEHNFWQEAQNVTVFTKPEPFELDDCILFPCPLKEKYSTKDPTAWIDAGDVSKPAIGLAHGNVEGLPTEEPDYPIPRDAASRHGLDYLALGHWHSFSRYDDGGVCRMAYAGTHETTKFGERDSGTVVLVEIPERGASPSLTLLKTGRFAWKTIERLVDQAGALDSLMQEIGDIDQPSATLARIRLEGILFPDDRKILTRVEEVLSSQFLFGVLDASRLIPAPDDDRWFESLPAGPFREAASRLRRLATQSGSEEERVVATQALLQLFELQERVHA